MGRAGRGRARQGGEITHMGLRCFRLCFKLFLAGGKLILCTFQRIYIIRPGREGGRKRL